MLKFYHNSFSPYSHCVWIAIQVKKISVELVTYSATDPYSIELFDYIPTIIDDGFEIADSLDILDYLEAKYPTPALLPKDPKALATVKMVATISINHLLPAVTPWLAEMMGWTKSNETPRQRKAQTKALATCNAHQESERSQLEQSERQILSVLTLLENLLTENIYFGGDRITLAEVVAGTVIPLLPTLGISLDDFPLLKVWSLRLTKWSAWVETQPQWQRERQFSARSSGREITSLHKPIATLSQFESQPAFNLQVVKQAFSVNFQYEVHFTKNLFAIDNPLLARTIARSEIKLPKKVMIPTDAFASNSLRDAGALAPSADWRLSSNGDKGTRIKKAIAVVDAGLLTHYPQLLTQIKDYARQWADCFRLEIEPITVLAGEAAKNNPQLASQIYAAIEQARLCRHSYLLAIGGGAVLDMVGYAAATAHRGIRLIRVPTTVLAQNDSGVGVKNSINAFGKKNFLGTFAPPYAVLNDVEFLTTLEDRDWRSGVAEAIKVALIKDADFFAFIAAKARAIASRNLDVMSQIVYRCAQLHLQHIATSGDPFEAGSSRPLDFGHWAAHRLEHLTDYRLRHGEAVAIGIALDCTYSYLHNLLPYGQWQQILITLNALGFNLYVPELAWRKEPHSLFSGLTEFREHLGGELTLMLLQQIGWGIEVHEVNIMLYEQAVVELREFTNARAMAISG
jgi:3-dehydroquinate synthase